MIKNIFKILGVVLYACLAYIFITSSFNHKYSTTSHGCGTAFFINTQGYLLTAGHVFEEAASGLVKINGHIYEVDLIAKDVKNDFAIGRVNGIKTSYLPLQSDFIEGAVALYGYPLTNRFGDNLKINYGYAKYGDSIVSGTVGLRMNVYPGNSGGPVVDRGVVGIETHGVLRQSDGPGYSNGYATPIDKVMIILDDLHILYHQGTANSSSNSIVRICT